MPKIRKLRKPPKYKTDPKTGKRILSEAEIAARRANAQKSTGPRTREGKAITSRNAWKHGLRSEAADLIKQNWLVGAFARPCTKGCQWHPENEKVPTGRACTLVLDGLTKAGGDCLDKTVYLTAFDRLVQTLQRGSAEPMHEILAAEAAGAIELLQQLRSEIAQRGLVIMTPLLDKDGQPILDKHGDPYPGKPHGNPALPHYAKLLGELGLNLPEIMATPKALKDAERAEDSENAIAAMIGGALARVGSRRPMTIDHEED